MSPSIKRQLAYGRPPIVQRRALAIAARNNGSLVRIGAIYRASFLSGAEKVRVETVHALIAQGHLAFTGSNLVRLTVSGEALAQDMQRMEAQGNAAIEAQRAKREARAKKPRQRHAAMFTSENNPNRPRLPYADN